MRSQVAKSLTGLSLSLSLSLSHFWKDYIYLFISIYVHWLILTFSK